MKGRPRCVNPHSTNNNPARRPGFTKPTQTSPTHQTAKDYYKRSKNKRRHRGCPSLTNSRSHPSHISRHVHSRSSHPPRPPPSLHFKKTLCPMGAEAGKDPEDSHNVGDVFENKISKAAGGEVVPGQDSSACINAEVVVVVVLGSRKITSSTSSCPSTWTSCPCP